MDISQLNLSPSTEKRLRWEDITTISKLFEIALNGKLCEIRQIGTGTQQEIYVALLKLMAQATEQTTEAIKPPITPYVAVAIEGVTLRDFFASQAMQGLMKDHFEIGRSEWYREDVVKKAFAMADTVIRIRGL